MAVSLVQLLFSSYLLSAENHGRITNRTRKQNLLFQDFVIKEMSVKKAVEDYKEKIVILRVEKGEKMCDFSTSIHL